MDVKPLAFSLATACRVGPAVLLCAAAMLPSTVIHAAPPAAVDHLLSRLPDPAQWNKSPLENALEDDVRRDPAFQRLAIDVGRKDKAGALKEARGLSARFPDSHAKIHLIEGILALSVKEYAEADKAFRVYNAMEPHSGAGWYGIARVQLAQKRVPDALASSKNAVAADPTFTVGWLQIAVCQELLHRPTEALATAQHATQVNPRSAQCWYVLGLCEAGQRRFDRAEGDLQRAVNIAPKSLPANGALAFCYIASNRPADAIPPLERVVHDQPTDVVAATKLAYCYMQTGKPARGVDVCRQAVKLQPNYGAAWDMLGLCCRRTGNNRQAVDAFEHALKISPADLNARTHLDEARQAAAGHA